MKTAIITDSNSGLTLEQANQLGVFLLPMPVIIDEKSHLEGHDISVEQLFEAMESGKSYSTSQPSPASVTDLWDSVLAMGYDQIVHIPMSGGLSGSCQCAIMFARDYEGKVFVADNRRISITQEISVREAKRMADAGCSGAEIKAYLEETALEASIYITVSSLKHLQKGGRLSSTAAVLGTMLNIKPILSIQGKQIDAVAKVRGMKQCQKKMLESMQHDLETRFADVPAEKLHINAAGTLQTPEEIEAWRSTVQECFPNVQVGYAALPCSIACHVGPECMGVALCVAEH